ncbi:MAG: hypothetical protein JNK74_20120 [Candidatus Hydrogenedentes bacterium]|nr:hypothetical protein [Candidatus Hydrogenedentota bacterium]
MWVALVLAIGALAAEGETSEITTVKTLQDGNALYEVTGWVERETITSGERKGIYTEWAHIKILRKGGGATWEGPFKYDIGIDALVVTGESQFATVSQFPMSMGHRVVRWQISDALVPAALEEINCYSPYLAPNRKWVFYNHWYPRMGTPEECKHTSTWMLDITQPEFKPVLVYPPDNATGVAPDGRIHSALISGSAPLWSADSRKLYYFDRLSEEHNWEGAVVSLVEIQIGQDMTIEKTTAFPIKLEDFARPGADLTKLAFYPEELYWAGEGVIGGTLSAERRWKSEAFLMSVTGEYVDSSDRESQTRESTDGVQVEKTEPRSDG